MSTLQVRRGRRIDVRNALVVAAFGLWLASLAGTWLGLVHLPISAAARFALWFGVPLITTAVVLLRESRTPALPVVAGGACAVVVAVFFAPLFAAHPRIGLAVPAVVLAAVATHRFPAASLTFVFLLSSTYGSIQAFTGVPPGQVADFVIGGLWVGIAGGALINGRETRVWITPALLLLAGCLGVALLMVPFSDAAVAALKSFRLSYWHLTVLLLIGYGGYKARTLDRVSKAITLIALGVAAYATIRWMIGHPAAKETALITSYNAQYNQVGGETKVMGSLPDGQELGLWMSCVVPFLIAMAIGARGRQRAIALVAIPIAAFGLFGSGQRTAAAAITAGVATIVIVHVVSRGYRGPRLGVALASIAAVVVTAGVVFPLVVDNPEKRVRYENLLHPSRDVSFQSRLDKWRQVIADVRGHPFGFGLGTGDPAAVPQRTPGIGSDNIDNTYFKIAYEQGIAIAVLFLVTLVVLLVELVRFAIWTRAPGEAGLAIAAAGTLVSMMVEFVSGIHIDSFATTAGWMIVGFGVAQYGTQRLALPAQPSAS